MSTPNDPVPSTSELCGVFEEPAVRDAGRSYPAAIKPTCQRPTEILDGTASTVYVDGEPVFVEN